MGLPIRWLQHLSLESKERTDLEAAIRNDTLVLTRLQQIITENLQTLDREEIKDDFYENPSWAYRQSFTNGKRAAYVAILTLLAFLDQPKERK